MEHQLELNPVSQRPILADELVALREIDAMTSELRARNKIRVQEMKDWLGTKYVLHPAHSPKHITEGFTKTVVLTGKTGKVSQKRLTIV